MRDIDTAGDIDWNALVRTELPATREHGWLASGDVLFAARGARNYAVHLASPPPLTVCAQYFFILRSRTDALFPPYLAWLINRAPSQRYLTNNAEGSDQLSIRRGVLEALPIAVPDLRQQRLIVELATSARQEQRCYQALIQNREQLQDSLALQLLTPPNRPL